MVKCDDGACGRRKRDREMGQLGTGLTQNRGEQIMKQIDIKHTNTNKR